MKNWKEDWKLSEYTYVFELWLGLKAMKPGEVQTYLPPPPHQIVEYLNGHIIGHYVMKKAISVAIYNHFCNINFSRYFLRFKVLTASSCLVIWNVSVKRENQEIICEKLHYHQFQKFTHVPILE